MEVVGLSDDFVGRLFRSSIGVEVDCGYHCSKFPIKSLLPFLHGAVEVLLRDWWIGGCRVVHGLDLLGDCLSWWGLSEADYGVVWLRPIDASFVCYKIDSPPKYVCGFVHPFGVDRGIQALNVTPSVLFFFLEGRRVSEAHSDNVVLSKELLHSLDDG